jgi:hypothetical protein
LIRFSGNGGNVALAAAINALNANANVNAQSIKMNGRLQIIEDLAGGLRM